MDNTVLNAEIIVKFNLGNVCSTADLKCNNIDLITMVKDLISIEGLHNLIDVEKYEIVAINRKPHKST